MASTLISVISDQAAPSTFPLDYLNQYQPNMPTAEYRRRLKDWCFAAYEEGEIYLKGTKEAQEVSRELSYLLGEQWPSRRPTYKAAPINNVLLRSMERTVAVLTDIRPAYEVKAVDELFAPQALTLTKATRSWWLMQDVDFQLTMAVIHAYLSTGYLRLVYNKFLRDMQVQPLGIHEILPIGSPCHDLQLWDGVIYRSIRPISWFMREFPTEGAFVKPSREHSRYSKEVSRPGYLPQTAWDYMSPQMKRIIGGPAQFGASVVAQAPYREFWFRDYSLNVSRNDVTMGKAGSNWSYVVKPGQPLYPRGRLVITGGDDMHCVYDGPNFFWHSRWPFIPVRLKPIPFQFHGLSELRTKLPMQDIINHILAGVLDMIKKAINPAFLFPENAFSRATASAMDPSMPNAKIAYSQSAMGQAIQWANPPVLPAYVPNMIQYMENAIDDDSGLLDLTSMAKKKVTPASDTLASLMEGQQTVMRLRGRNMCQPIREMGRQNVSNFMQFYTLKKRMWLLGKDGITFEDVYDWDPDTMVPAGVDPYEHIQKFPFLVGESSLLNVNQTEKKLQSFALRRQGDYSRKQLFEDLDIGHLYDKVEKELKEEFHVKLDEQAAIQESVAAAGAAGGIPDTDGGGIGTGGGSVANGPGAGDVPTHQGMGADNPANILGS